MKKLFKWLFRLVLVLVLLIVLLILFLDPIAKAVAERRIRDQTGLPVKIGKLSIGLRRPTLSIENFKLGNSPISGARRSSIFHCSESNTTCRRCAASSR